MEHPCRIVTLIPASDGWIRSWTPTSMSVTRWGPAKRSDCDCAGNCPARGIRRVTFAAAGHPGRGVVAQYRPQRPSQDPVGALAQRRITDAAADVRRCTLIERQKGYTAGDTDLAWTRTTVWRLMLAASLDLPFAPITSVDVRCERSNPSGALLQAWLHNCLRRAGRHAPQSGPGHFRRHDQYRQRADRPVTPGRTYRSTVEAPCGFRTMYPCPVTDLKDLIGEELRRLDPDETYAEALAAVRLEQPKSRRRTPDPADAEEQT